MLFKDYNFKQSERELFLECKKKIKKLLGTTSSGLWKENTNIKTAIKNIYVKTFYKLFNKNKSLIDHVYKMINNHQSDYVYIDNKLKKTSTNIVNYTVTKKREDTLIIGIFSFRFKASGSRVKDSWKINVEL